MKKVKYLLIFGLMGVLLWWLYETPKGSFTEFKTSASPEKRNAKQSSWGLSSVKAASFSKKALLYQTRKPAQARRELDPRVQDFLALRQKKNRKKAPAPEASELSETKIQLHQKSDYIFVKNRKAFKLSSEIRNQYPDGFVHLGFWVAKDESFLVDKVGLDVVYNPRHKTYGVVTGVLKVKMQDMRDQSDFSVSTGGEIFKSYDYILASLFKYQEKDALLGAQKFCEQDARFSLCEIEILENGRFAR